VTEPGPPVGGVRRAASDAGTARLLPIGLGIAVLVIGTLAGWDGGIITAIATPPIVVRAGLTAAAVVIGLRLLSGAIARIEASEPTETGYRDLVSLTRGVRLAFLAVAAFAAAGGWFLGSALPLIVAFIIAGVDVVETSFLLVVMATRRET
jgi:hypothetical protein